MRAGSLQPLDQGKLEHLEDIEPGLRRLQQAYPHHGMRWCPTPGAP